MPPDPTVVWLVREGDPTAFEGTLSFEGEVLRFAPASGSDAVNIRTSEIRKVRRARASPVLTLWLASDQGGARLHFFFSKPPPLPAGTGVTPPGIFRSTRGLERSAAALSLRATSKLLKREIDAWVRELKRSRR